MAMPRRPSSSGMRPERFSAPELDPVGNGGLHAVEKNEAAEDDESDGKSGNEHEQPGSAASAGESPTEAVNHAHHGIEAVQPAPARRNHRGRIDDGRGEHPKLHEERDNVAHVAIKSVERGKPQADAESSENGEKQQHREPKSRERGLDAEGESEESEDHEADGKVHQAGKSGGNGQDEAGEINFGDEVLVVDDDVSGHLEGVGEIGPGNERGKIKDGIGEAVGGELGEAAEEYVEDQHVQNGLENDPENADGGLFVADLDVAPDEKIKEFAVGPDFAEAELEKAARRLDANGRGGPGRERKSDAGLRDGCHE